MDKVKDIIKDYQIIHQKHGSKNGEGNPANIVLILGIRIDIGEAYLSEYKRGDNPLVEQL